MRRNIVFVITQALVLKSIGFACQLALAWLLIPDDFGLFAAATSVSNIISVLQSAGLRQSLVHNFKDFERLSNPAFTLALSVGVIGILISLGLATAGILKGADATSIIVYLLLACVPIGDSYALPASARLQAEGKFKQLSGIGIAAGALNGLLSVALALCGLGAIGLAIARLAASSCSALLALKISRCNVHVRFDREAWGQLLNNSKHVVIAYSAFSVAAQIPILTLTFTSGAKTAGLFAFAVTLAQQFMLVISGQLDAVFLSAAAREPGPAGNKGASMLQGISLLGYLLMPLYSLQILCTPLLLRAFYAPEWHESIPYTQALSFGYAALSVALPLGGLVQGYGRFDIYRNYALFTALSTSALFIVAYKYSSLAHASGALSVGNILGASYLLFTASRLVGLHAASVLRELLIPCILSIAAAIATHALLAKGFSGPTRSEVTSRMFATASIFSALYALCSIISNRKIRLGLLHLARRPRRSPLRMLVQ